MTADWTEETSVGVEAIDVHHRELWRRIRQLAKAISDGRTDEVRAALRVIHGTLAEYHADEERWMIDAGYPGAREHARSHSEMQDRVRTAVEGEKRPAPEALHETVDWVAQALQSHVRSEDAKLGRFFTARENLRRLAEARSGIGPPVAPLTGAPEPLRLTPLPGALEPVRPTPPQGTWSKPPRKP